MSNKAPGDEHASQRSRDFRIKSVERELTDLVLQQSGRKRVRKERIKAVALLRDLMYMLTLSDTMYNLLVLRHDVPGRLTQDQAWNQVVDHIEQSESYAEDRPAIIQEARELMQYEAKYRTLKLAKDLYNRLISLQQPPRSP